MHFVRLLPTPISAFTGIPNISSLALCTAIVDGGHLQPNWTLSKCNILSLNKLSRLFPIYSLPKLEDHEAARVSFETEDPSENSHNNNHQVCMGSLWESVNEVDDSVDKSDGYLMNGLNGAVNGSTRSRNAISDEEYQRRRRIGLANKGKTPWNKGRKHSAETRALIKQRTLEALQNPKVRKKMSECPRAHTAQSKTRIGLALRKVWGKRLKSKRFQEKCYSIWAQHIAEEARKGGHDQGELAWDSFDKIKAELQWKLLQWDAVNAKAKELAKVRAEQAAKARADKMERLAKMRRERVEKRKARDESKKKLRRKMLEEKEKLAILKRLKLKARLTKKKAILAPVADQGKAVNAPELAIDKWDLESIKTEKMRRETSLADLIQAAKNRKLEHSLKGDSGTGSCFQ